jgi:hypothetical protein
MHDLFGLIFIILVIILLIIIPLIAVGWFLSRPNRHLALWQRLIAIIFMVIIFSILFYLLCLQPNPDDDWAA